MPGEPPVGEPSRWRRYHLLALLPMLGMLGGLPFANRVHPMVLGLPFLMAWLVGWVLATAGIMAFILRLDRLNGIATDEVQGHGGVQGHGHGGVQGKGWVQGKGGVRREADEDVR